MNFFNGLSNTMPLWNFHISLSATSSGFLIMGGTYYYVRAYEDMSVGHISAGMIKALLGTAAIASGMCLFINHWQSMITDAEEMHCHWWRYPEKPYRYMQYCNAYNCEIPFSPSIEAWKYEDCPLLIESISKEGFANAYEMKNAKIYND